MTLVANFVDIHTFRIGVFCPRVATSEAEAPTNWMLQTILKIQIAKNDWRRQIFVHEDRCLINV